jgi:hypothetical protein
MTPKTIGDLTVNDGKGLLDNDGLCDSLIIDLNNLIKLILNGQYIQFSATVTGMVQKLVNLKKGIKDDLDSMKEKVEELKRMNDSLVEQMTGLPVDKDGDENGEN